MKNNLPQNLQMLPFSDKNGKDYSRGNYTAEFSRSKTGTKTPPLSAMFVFGRRDWYPDFLVLAKITVRNALLILKVLEDFLAMS